MVLFEIVLATVIVSTISFIGVILLSFNKDFLTKLIPVLVSFAAGVLLGDAFVHAIPESIKLLGVDPALLLVISGFLAFFTIEKTLHWHHHWRTGSEHTEDEEKSGHAANLILIGDGVHNFADGVIIATSFIADLSLGVITTIAIILHEIPQEMGDFGVLIHSGMGRKKAIWYNFLSAVTAVGGGVLTYFFLSISTALVNFSLPVAAGGLLYIASADLIPELHHEKNFKIGLLQIFTLIGGVVIMYYLKAFFG